MLTQTDIVVTQTRVEIVHPACPECQCEMQPFHFMTIEYVCRCGFIKRTPEFGSAEWFNSIEPIPF